MGGSRDFIEVDVDDYRRLAKLSKTVDKSIRTIYTKTLRDIGKPFGRFILVSAGSQLPQRGGLGYRVASGTVSTTVSTMQVTIRLKSQQGYDFKQMDSGLLRHPVFAKPEGERTLRSRHAQRRIASGVSKLEDVWTWTSQTIPRGVFTRPFEEGAPFIRREMLAAGQRVLDELGRGVAS